MSTTTASVLFFTSLAFLAVTAAHAITLSSDEESWRSKISIVIENVKPLSTAPPTKQVISHEVEGLITATIHGRTPTPSSPEGQLKKHKPSPPPSPKPASPECQLQKHKPSPPPSPKPASPDCQLKMHKPYPPPPPTSSRGPVQSADTAPTTSAVTMVTDQDYGRSKTLPLPSMFI